VAVIATSQQSCNGEIVDDEIEFDELAKNVSELEHKLGLPKGFFDQLLKEDDWSFIVKTHSLLDAALTLSISKAMGNEALDDFISSLPLNDSRRGKIALAKALKLIEPITVSLFRQISELRNKLVHNVLQTNFDFSAHLPTLKPDEFQLFCDVFGQTYGDTVVSNDGNTYALNDYIQTHPKVAVWRTCLMQLAMFTMLIESQELKKDHESLQAIHYKQMTEFYERWKIPSNFPA